MYKLSIGAVFKNEGFGIGEWIRHYIQMGVEHFYLINDESTDHWRECLKPYMDKITLFDNDIPKQINGHVNKNRQVQIYTRYLGSIRHETEWLIIVDLDEYMYSPDGKQILDIVNKYAPFYSQIQVDWLMFGSNGYKQQPSSIRTAFTKRSDIIYSYKSIVKTSEIREFHIHACVVNGSTIRLHLNNEKYAELICNHYRVQSEQYWREIAMKRGDADCNESDTYRDMSIFHKYDHNDVEDHRLSALLLQT